MLQPINISVLGKCSCAFVLFSACWMCLGAEGQPQPAPVDSPVNAAGGASQFAPAAAAVPGLPEGMSPTRNILPPDSAVAPANGFVSGANAAAPQGVAPSTTPALGSNTLQTLVKSESTPSTPAVPVPAAVVAALNTNSPLGTNSLDSALTALDLTPEMSTNAMGALDDKHRLAIGDRLSLRILEDEEEPKSLFVTDAGELEVPYIGRFAAEGKTCLQLARELKTELEMDYYHQATVLVSVDLKAKTRGRIYLAGPVRSSAPQEVPTDETYTLSKAILRAGGFSDFADRKNVRVTRKGAGPNGEDKVFIVDVAAILEKRKTQLDIVLEPGDIIYVPERGIRF